ncbi:MAG: inositol monophosphatase [Actinomycetota bacterium]|nr:inositol monophosphatase [Actinomycetota bacterium]
MTVDNPLAPGAPRPADDLPDLDTEVAAVDVGLPDDELAVALVTRAGALAARLRDEGLQAERKTSVSDLVTAADRAAEAFVTRALAHARPDDGWVGEEGARRESRSGRTWLVDPVDGTYNFFTGSAYWCSALALSGPDGVVLGAVHQPVLGSTWVGGPQLPTRLDMMPVTPLLDRAAVDCAMATYLHPTTLSSPDILEPWMAAARTVATIRMLGSSSCDLAAVASGQLGLWAQHSVLDWDWYPGHALVLGAGGVTRVVEHRGRAWHLAGSAQAVAELLGALLAS